MPNMHNQEHSITSGKSLTRSKQTAPTAKAVSLRPATFQHYRSRPQPEGDIWDNIPPQTREETYRNKEELEVAEWMWIVHPNTRKFTLSWLEDGLVFTWKCKCKECTKRPRLIDCRSRVLHLSSARTWWKDRWSRTQVLDTTWPYQFSPWLRASCGQAASVPFPRSGNSLPTTQAKRSPASLAPA
jgi:hypothetical protein